MDKFKPRTFGLEFRVFGRKGLGGGQEFLYVVGQSPKLLKKFTPSRE